MSTTEPTTRALVSISPLALRHRVLRMTTVWAGLGAVMGLSLGMTNGGLVGAVTGIIVGTIEMVVLGALFAVIGGRPGESLVGGGCGLMIGLVAGLVGGHASPVSVTNFGLVVGAIGGATLRPYLRLVTLPVVLLRGRQGRRAQALHRSPGPRLLRPHQGIRAEAIGMSDGGKAVIR